MASVGIGPVQCEFVLLIECDQVEPANSSSSKGPTYSGAQALPIVGQGIIAPIFPSTFRQTFAKPTGLDRIFPEFYGQKTRRVEVMFA